MLLCNLQLPVQGWEHQLPSINVQLIVWTLGRSISRVDLARMVCNSKIVG